MKNKLTTLVVATITTVSFFACTDSNTQNAQTPFANDKYAVDPVYSKLDWCNDLIRDYIARSKDELLVVERQDTSVHFEWYLDRTANEYGKKYMIFHLGHEVSDEGNTNVRFVTNGWLYIDSLSRKLYIYDFALDTIVLWE